jgi:trehalose-6-phosphate synthase
MRGMRRQVFRNDLDHWAESFFDALTEQRPKDAGE